MNDPTSDPAEIADPGESRPLRNADCRWELFDSDWYLSRNYGTLRNDDRTIIDLVARFFATKTAVRGGYGIDVGSGTNLYPALAMLPLTRALTLWEYSPANISWLENGIRPYNQSWDQFWDALCSADDMYKRVRRPQALLPVMTKIERASIFDLPVAKWDIGTMFFVAESITGLRDEFERATTSFIKSLKAGAPFAAAFMRNSLGYSVGAQRFPAVAITEDDVRRQLGGHANDMTVHRIEVESRNPLRDGYDGMVLVTGTRSTSPTAKRRAVRTLKSGSHVVKVGN